MINKAEKRQSYIGTHVADQNTTIIVATVSGQQVQTHSDLLTAVTKGHTLWFSVVSNMDGAIVGRCELDPHIHGPTFAGGCDMRCKLSGWFLCVYLKQINIRLKMNQILSVNYVFNQLPSSTHTTASVESLNEVNVFELFQNQDYLFINDCYEQCLILEFIYLYS